jgi:Uma2 family endonuclease
LNPRIRGCRSAETVPYYCNMTAPATSFRPFEPGTTGWTVDDLNDPEIARLWDRGAYEIVEGVLTKMPPAYHDGTLPLARLRRIIERHLDAHRIAGELTTEDDVVIGPKRVVRVDMMFVTPEDHKRQQAANAERGNPQLKFGRMLVPPTLIIESLSPGHESHDNDTKREWYAQARVPNYWLLNAYGKSLECLVLERDQYRTDQSGRNADEVRPALYPGLIVPLASLWA